MTSGTEAAEALRKVLSVRLLDVHTAMPGKVVSYDPEEQIADVDLMVKEVFLDQDGAEVVASYPRLYSVPVIFPRSSRFFLSFPIAEGDFVLVLLPEWSIDRFRELGREVHPIDMERHGLTGAVAYPGLYPTASALQEADSSKMALGHDRGIQIRIDSEGGAEISSVNGTSQYVALSDKVKAQLDKLHTYLAAINGVLTGVPIPEPGNGAPSALQVALASAIALVSGLPSMDDVGSTKVKAEE